MIYGPIDYFLCNLTVTIYRKVGNRIDRQVQHGCFYTWEQEQTEDEMGVRRETKGVLILPGSDHYVNIGDRIVPGEGRVIDLKDWDTFIPSTYPGMIEVNYATLHCWNGEICHVEAGRK